MRFVKQNGWSRTALVLMCVAIGTLLLSISPHNEVFADDNELAAVSENRAGGQHQQCGHTQNSVPGHYYSS